MRVGRQGLQEVGEANTGESGVVMSVAVERQLPKDSQELERVEDMEEEDGAEGMGVGARTGDLRVCRSRTTSLPLALCLSPSCHSTAWRRLSSNSVRTEALRLWGAELGIGKPAMRLASSTRSEASRGNSWPFMALMTSLKETERLWRPGEQGKGFLASLGERQGKAEVEGLDGGMKEYWNGSWSRLLDRGVSNRD